MKHANELLKYNFRQVSEGVEDGMGASISFSNQILSFELINDKSQIFIDIFMPGRKGGESLSFFMALVHAKRQGLSFKEIAPEDKSSFYSVQHDYIDPLPDFFNYLDEITLLLSEDNISDTKTELSNFLRGRGKWMFK